MESAKVLPWHVQDKIDLIRSGQEPHIPPDCELEWDNDWELLKWRSGTKSGSLAWVRPSTCKIRSAR